MSEFLGAILAFPTVIFTALLGLVLLYWLVVLLGLLDIDVLDPIEGAIEGAVEAATDGAIEGALEAGDAPEGGPSGLARGLQALGLLQVPLTLSLSVLVLFSWILCFLGMRLVDRTVPAGWLDAGAAEIGIGVVVGLAAPLLGMLLAALAVRPLRPIFVTRDAPRRASFVGTVCTVTSGRVDAGFGQAEIEDGGGGLRVDVRCEKPNSLARGSKALVFDYDPKKGIYHVSPVRDALESEHR